MKDSLREKADQYRPMGIIGHEIRDTGLRDR